MSPPLFANISVVEKARKDLGDNLTGRLGENRREPGFSDAAED